MRERSSSATMRILVTGASGFAGSLLAPRLAADGHTVRAMGRQPQRVRAALAHSHSSSTRQAGEDGDAHVDVVRADVLSAHGLAAALADVDVAYYLIHSMERPTTDRLSFPERERLAAENFAAAAVHAGVRRIVYLGGLTPRIATARERAGSDADVQISRHLASRAHVERVLLDALPHSLALRASIVIGARSRSFRLLVHLLERLPVLTLPAWHTLRTQPIDARDVIEMLAACATANPPRRSLDIGGPDVLTYGDLLPADDHAAELLGVRLHSFDSAVEHALAEWEQTERLAAR
jgi:uncharacterized protein YbjT (DUF2867 family)